MDDRGKTIAIGMLAVAVLFLLIVLSTSCAPTHAVANAPVIDRPTYVYIASSTDKYVVWVKEGSDSQVREELCTASYVCSVGNAGRVITIERKRK